MPTIIPGQSLPQLHQAIISPASQETVWSICFLVLCRSLLKAANQSSANSFSFQGDIAQNPSLTKCAPLTENSLRELVFTHREFRQTAVLPFELKSFSFFFLLQIHGETELLSVFDAGESVREHDSSQM